MIRFRFDSFAKRIFIRDNNSNGFWMIIKKRMIRLITIKTKTVTRTVSWEMNWNNFHDIPTAVMNGMKEKGMGRRNGKTNKRIKSYNHKE